MNVSQGFVTQIMKDLALLVLIQDGEEHWDVAYTMVKVPTGYGILIVMISLSPLGLRARGVLMETVDAYYGKSFLFGKPRVVGTGVLMETVDAYYGKSFCSGSLEGWVHFFKGLVHNGIYNSRVFTSRVFQICIFSCDLKWAKGYQRQLEQPSYSTITSTYQWRQVYWSTGYILLC